MEFKSKKNWGERNHPNFFRLDYYFFILLISLLASCGNRVDPKVTHVYPSADTLPENLLRMYIQFSHPMKTVGNIEKVRLIDEQGKEVQALFNNVYELWDKEQKQLTIIFDPARVKTGLIANESMGRALQSGSKYSLNIRDLETVNHQTIAPYLKEFYVISSDMTKPNINNWQINNPTPSTTNPLLIQFSETADWMSINHRIMVFDKEGNPLDGSISIRKNEKEWVFVPEEKWLAGDYNISVNARFADPSGNNLNGLFDHSTGSLKFESEDKIVRLKFEID